MLHITYKLLPSELHGIGCFSDEYIPSWFCIVEASPLLDINISDEQFLALSYSEQNEIRHHGHFDKVTKKWHVDFDMTRFANHSFEPNIQQGYNSKGYYIVAVRDIKKWEELMIDYWDFENTDSTRGEHIFS